MIPRRKKAEEFNEAPESHDSHRARVAPLPVKQNHHHSALALAADSEERSDELVPESVVLGLSLDAVENDAGQDAPEFDDRADDTPEFTAPAEESQFNAISVVELPINDHRNEQAQESSVPTELKMDSGSLGVKNSQYVSDYVVENPGFHNVGTPAQLIERLAKVGYQCLEFLAFQMSLLLNTPTTKTRALLLEGPSGCGKTFMAKSLAKIVGAELMCLSCYEGMLTQNLIEYPSTLAMANAMTGKNEAKAEDLLNLGIITRAFQKSQTQPVILLIDEIDKTARSIDTFFLGPIQDARIWLESRAPIDADPENLLVIFTKNFNRKLDEAFLRRCHPIKMTYLDSTLERKILSPHCHPQLVANLVTVADRMRNSGGSYAFERPPAPEELLTAGQYVTKLLEWGTIDFGFVGKNIWAILAKSEHDRAVLEHMMRFHPDFMDPLIADGRDASLNDVYARLGRIVLFNLVQDPDKERRDRAWEEIENF